MRPPICRVRGVAFDLFRYARRAGSVTSEAQLEVTLAAALAARDASLGQVAVIGESWRST
jgi:hypothetical protein